MDPLDRKNEEGAGHDVGQVDELGESYVRHGKLS